MTEEPTQPEGQPVPAATTDPERAPAVDTPVETSHEAATDGPTDTAAGWRPTVLEPETEAPAEEPPPPPAEGMVRIRYNGPADRADWGDYTFRPGDVTDVPADVAEELLTWPNERFEDLGAKPESGEATDEE